MLHYFKYYFSRGSLWLAVIGKALRRGICSDYEGEAVVAGVVVLFFDLFNLRKGLLFIVYRKEHGQEP